MPKVKEPPFTIIHSALPFETRLYQPTVTAQVEVSGERKSAINAGFRLLADYIFGNNTTREKITMTAPVTQQAQGHHWQVRFVMPEGSTLSSLSKPNNAKVSLQTIPAQKFIVIKFSGFHSDRNIRPHQLELNHYIQVHKLKTIGDPIIAFYNPPWTLPFLRRNEIMWQIE